MSENHGKCNGKDFLVGTFIGGIIGASLALLLAPKSGRELRTKLNEQAQVAKEKGVKLSENAKEKTTYFLDKVKSSTSKYDDEGSEITEQVLLEHDDLEQSEEEKKGFSTKTDTEVSWKEEE